MVTPAECQRLLSNSRGTDTVSTPIQGAAGRTGAAADVHVPPAIEFGIDDSGRLAVASAPKLPDGSREQQAPTCLAMDLATMDTESVILRAAAANACIQLGEALHTIIDSMTLAQSAADSPQQHQNFGSCLKAHAHSAAHCINHPLIKVS